MAGSYQPDFWTILYAVAAAQGYFLNVVLFSIKKGNRAAFASANIFGPVGIAVAAGDTIYVANCRNSPNASIAKVTPNGVSSIFVSSSLLDCPNGLTIDPDGNLYTCNFNNGRELASGVYLYRLEAGEYTLTRKMLLLN